MGFIANPRNDLEQGDRRGGGGGGRAWEAMFILSAGDGDIWFMDYQNAGWMALVSPPVGTCKPPDGFTYNPQDKDSSNAAF